MSGEVVQLAIYDLSQGMARQLSAGILGMQIDGIWHTGLIVYGREYFFGGGIQSMPHESFVASHGGFRPIEIKSLGSTQIPRELFEEYLNEIRPRFSMHTYDLITNNCNNFTNEACQFLLGHGIPDHIVNLPQQVFSTPLG
eukprot:CAMPEP_0113951818 /NCGR_PEP_ID=MMETSP1339-20121228/88052_1 /TAXON_ID=94617 /ORGANISM="Fibrocapsa japonica" /LENGTH=140 /DNA_ID=CAMNT_0000960199 /DNA_START=28 /DNA_END=446 /DNA_ORIENTATION=+ /assembly_acc=CAM_ASM_000762